MPSKYDKDLQETPGSAPKTDHLLLGKWSNSESNLTKICYSRSPAAKQTNGTENIISLQRGKMDDNLTFLTMQTIQRKRVMVVRYNMAQS